ncbi:hypothetical protein M513_09547, partial [Trichuris suis]
MMNSFKGAYFLAHTVEHSLLYYYNKYRHHFSSRLAMRSKRGSFSLCTFALSSLNNATVSIVFKVEFSYLPDHSGNPIVTDAIKVD